MNRVNLITANDHELGWLETYIDSHSVESLLTAIADICNEKSLHIRANWQDDKLADVWDRVADNVQTASEYAYNKGV